MVRFFQKFYAKKVFTNDVMSSIALDVTLSFHRGVYCSMVMHPKALCWKKSFLEIEDQNLLSGARSVLTFGRRSYQILVWQCGQVICSDPMHWLFGPWNGLGIVLCDFTIVFFQN